MLSTARGVTGCRVGANGQFSADTRLASGLLHSHPTAPASSPAPRTIRRTSGTRPLGSSGATLAGHTDAVAAAAFSPDGKRVLTGSEDRSARLWDAATGKFVAILAERPGSVMAVAFSTDGTHVLTGSWDKTAQLW